MKTQQMQGLTLAISFDLVGNGSPDEMIHLQKLKGNESQEWPKGQQGQAWQEA